MNHTHEDKQNKKNTETTSSIDDTKMNQESGSSKSSLSRDEDRELL